MIRKPYTKVAATQRIVPIIYTKVNGAYQVAEIARTKEAGAWQMCMNAMYGGTFRVTIEERYTPPSPPWNEEIWTVGYNGLSSNLGAYSKIGGTDYRAVIWSFYATYNKGTGNLWKGYMAFDFVGGNLNDDGINIPEAPSVIVVNVDGTDFPFTPAITPSDGRYRIEYNDALTSAFFNFMHARAGQTVTVTIPEFGGTWYLDT